jgi:hypothetical protein
VVTDVTRVGGGGGAGLVLRKSVDKAAALPGELLVYTIPYRKNGTEAFTAEDRERIRAASRRALRSALRLHVFRTGDSGAVSVVVALGAPAGLATLERKLSVVCRWAIRRSVK